ncbi:MAG TPA: ABC transporter permease [Gammaproteobacteria bacterium]|nr:ABC transporter permease [Gammaproteobacteria bacterium]
MNGTLYWRALVGILRREWLRFVHQRGRFVAALVRPLVWLLVFATGFRAVLGLSIIPPYDTYVLYPVYITPGLAGMILLFHGMQSSLAMVYDRELGSMRVLLTSPLPRWYLLFARLLASTLTALPLVYVFLAVAWFYEVRPPALGYLAVLPALLLAGLLLGALGLLLSALIRQLENFAGVMNFVIFPLFFTSTALYPLWRLAEASPLLATLAAVNPFSHAIELIRFALYLRLQPQALAVVLATLALCFALAVLGYDPGRGLWGRRGHVVDAS